MSELRAAAQKQFCADLERIVFCANGDNGKCDKEGINYEFSQLYAALDKYVAALSAQAEPGQTATGFLSFAGRHRPQVDLDQLETWLRTELGGIPGDGMLQDALTVVMAWKNLRAALASPEPPLRDEREAAREYARGYEQGMLDAIQGINIKPPFEPPSAGKEG